MVRANDWRLTGPANAGFVLMRLYPPTCNFLLIEFEIDLLQNTNSVQVEFLNDIQVPEHISLV